MTANLDALSPADLRRLADEIESRECTGITADWCPVHGSCACPKDEAGVRMIQDGDASPTCPLHGNSSSHAASGVTL